MKDDKIYISSNEDKKLPYISLKMITNKIKVYDYSVNVLSLENIK